MIRVAVTVPSMWKRKPEGTVTPSSGSGFGWLLVLIWISALGFCVTMRWLMSMAPQVAGESLILQPAEEPTL